jgi:hypothetical protein
MKKIRLDVTTDTAGDGTSNLGPVPGGGFIYAVQCIDGDLADGVDLTLTAETGDVSISVLTVANFNSDRIYYPRVLECLNTDGTDLTTHGYPIAIGNLKAVVAAGGSVKTGAFVVYVGEF